MTSNQLSLVQEIKTFDESSLHKVLGRWKNSIQFSEIRGSIKPLDALLREITKIYLRDIKPIKESRVPGKAQALNMAWSKINSALVYRYGRPGRSVLRKGYSLKGKYEEHEFDLVVANGSPYFGAFTLSFMIRDSSALKKEVDAAAFAVEDVKRSDRSFQLALVALSPKGESESFNRAINIFKALKTPVIRENQIDRWTKEMVNKLPSNLLEQTN
jgi:hypothetical protein